MRRSIRCLGVSVSCVLWALAIVLVGAGCKSKSSDRAEAAASSDDSTKAAAGAPLPVHVTLSIDWEGAYFDDVALAALETFRKDHPKVPITHFLNAAYYTKPGAEADADKVTATVRRVILDGDDTGLHVHLWRSLVVAAGVTPKMTQSFLSDDGSMLDFENDVGFEIDPSAYTTSELRSIIKTSRELLAEHGFEVSPSFRIGGWVGTKEVLEAMRAEGFTVDSSATFSGWVGGSEGSDILGRRIKEVWPDITPTTQPFWIDTAAGALLEMPDTGCLADHLTAEEMEDHVVQAAKMAEQNAGVPVFVHLGFHAETAHHFAPLLSTALRNLEQRGIKMSYGTLTDHAALAQRTLGDPGAN